MLKVGYVIEQLARVKDDIKPYLVPKTEVGDIMGG